MTKQNSSNAREARGMTENTSKAASKGVDSMNRLSEVIGRIKTSADQTAKILKTIDDIAFQTNLLALNAAVEAARAGEAGKGFAVVAEEVRNLAMRSAEAAKNTADLIEESVKNAEDGVVVNDEVLKNLEGINSQVARVNEVMSEIASASEQQTQGIEQINVAVDQMNGLTQLNAANSEESASAAEELSSQAEEMRNMVGSFKLNEDNAFQAAYSSQAVDTASANLPSAKRSAAPSRTNAPDITVVGKQEASFRAKSSDGIKPEDAIPFDDDDTDFASDDDDVLGEF